MGNYGVGTVQVGLGAAVVPLKFYYLSPGKHIGEVHDILEICPPEGIDGLGIISNDHYIVMTASHKLHDLRLGGICILIFIHHYVLEPGTHGFSDLGMFFQHISPPEEQVVVIHECVDFFIFAIDRDKFFQSGQFPQEVRIALLNHLGYRSSAVLRLAHN